MMRANNEDQDEVTHYEQFHLNLSSLQFQLFSFLALYGLQIRMKQIITL